MKARTEKIDGMTYCLLLNGDIETWSSQELYERAWELGIRRLQEEDLKPDFLMRKRRRGPSMEGQHSNSVLGVSHRVLET
jgi:hypothetical protein